MSVSESQSNAIKKYRKNNVKSFNVKFFPDDRDLLDWFNAQDSKNAYLKNLIRRDMESKMTSSNKNEYSFESANAGTIEFRVCGDYVDGCKDVDVLIGSTGESREFDEVDGLAVDEMFMWLIDNGVKFESKRVLWFNYHYVASVMLDGDETMESLLVKADAKTAEQLEDWYEMVLS